MILPGIPPAAGGGERLAAQLEPHAGTMLLPHKAHKHLKAAQGMQGRDTEAKTSMQSTLFQQENR